MRAVVAALAFAGLNAVASFRAWSRSLRPPLRLPLIAVRSLRHQLLCWLRSLLKTGEGRSLSFELVVVAAAATCALFRAYLRGLVTFHRPERANQCGYGRAWLQQYRFSIPGVSVDPVARSDGSAKSADDPPCKKSKVCVA
ncbi:hypothetical protein MRX96_033344 [Rhipicephalus microplus]